MEKLYHAIVFIGALCAITIIAFLIYIVRPILGLFTVELGAISVVITLCFCCLLLAACYHVAGWLAAWSDTKRNHTRLIRHKDHSFWLQENGTPLHTGAIQESAQISTLALEGQNQENRYTDAIVEMYDNGRTINGIATDLKEHGITPYRVKKILRLAGRNT